MCASARSDWPTCRKHLEACVASPYAGKKASAQLAVVCDRLGDKAGAEKYAQQAARAPADVDWPDPYAAENMLFAVRQRHVYRAVETLEGQKKLADAAIILNRMVERYPDDYR